MLIEHLFAGEKFANIVGEEDETNVNITTRPFTVDDLTVPEEFFDGIESVRDQIKLLSLKIPNESYKKLTIFIDPIDGTREFATGLGGQCSIIIGFADEQGMPAAGIVYRPLTTPTTWAAGAKSEGCVLGNLDKANPPNSKGFLTSNGSISKFIGSLIAELGFERVPSGGAGNKMLMLLEGKGAAYIQDRGVSRWDTCGAQATIEAYGGTLSKLTSFVHDQSLKSYTYLKSPTNLDFESGVASLTAYNAADKTSVKKGEEKSAVDVQSVKAYSNLSGIFALDASCLSQVDFIYDSMQKVRQATPPSYD